MVNSVVAIDGQLLCLQRGPSGGWCVHCYQVDEVSRRFVLKRSVDIRGALGGGDIDLSTAELVAADAVTDTAASVPTVALAFRRRRGATHDYWLGTLLLESPAAACGGAWHAFEMAAVEAQLMVDGPALCMVHAIAGGDHALSVASLARGGCNGVQLRTVALAGRASLLGVTRWSGAAAQSKCSRPQQPNAAPRRSKDTPAFAKAEPPFGSGRSILCGPLVPGLSPCVLPGCHPLHSGLPPCILPGCHPVHSGLPPYLDQAGRMTITRCSCCGQPRARVNKSSHCH